MHQGIFRPIYIFNNDKDNIKEWTGMNLASTTRAAEYRTRLKGIVANSSVVPRRPSKVMG